MAFRDNLLPTLNSKFSFKGFRHICLIVKEPGASYKQFVFDVKTLISHT